jgi:tetratricopeptide (TPR) repeat protein
LKGTCTDSTENDFLKSIAFYDGRLSIDSTDQISYYRLGMCYFKLRNYNSAIQYFDKLIKLNPKWPAAYSNRGLCKLFLNRKNDACKDFLISVNNGEDYKILDEIKLSEWLQTECTL